MSIRIAITCDTSECGSYCETAASDVAAARARAAHRYGWRFEDGRDYCRTCPPALGPT